MLGKVWSKLGLDWVKFAVSGAVAIVLEVFEFVLVFGVFCCELWGMSELFCAAMVNFLDVIRIGIVGIVLFGVELRFVDDGELLVRGLLVMKGYCNDFVKTVEMVDVDGWLHIGDIVIIDVDGYVCIVDCKKELIINAVGKNMLSANIENLIWVNCLIVGLVVAIGDDWLYVVALVIFDPDVCVVYAACVGCSDALLVALAADLYVYVMVEVGINQVNERLVCVEQVKRFVIIFDSWEPGGDALTPTMKLKCKPIVFWYAAEIDVLYASG